MLASATKYMNPTSQLFWKNNNQNVFVMCYSKTQ